MSLESEGILDPLFCQACDAAPSIVVGTPDDISVTIQQFVWQAHLVGFEMENLAAFNQRDGGEATGLHDVLAPAVIAVFRHKGFTVPAEGDSVSLERFGKTPAHGVIAHVHGNAIGAAAADEAIGAVPFEAGFSVFGSAFDDVPCGIVTIMQVAKLRGSDGLAVGFASGNGCAWETEGGRVCSSRV